METLKGWSSLHEYVLVFMLLVTTTNGLPCEAPSSPECFRRNADESVYVCEWSLNTTESGVRFDLYFNKTKFNTNERTLLINEEKLIQYRPVLIWVVARGANSSCSSAKRSVILSRAVKYDAPHNISMSWLKNSLRLNWTAAEKHPALAEIQWRHDEDTTWKKRTTNTSSDAVWYTVILEKLLEDSVYQVQVRHRSNQARNPLWSDWSPVVTVPAELEQKPEVNVKTTLLNGTRMVTLTWKPMPHAASVGGVTYSLNDTQSSKGCPCEEDIHPISTNQHTMYVSLSAVNISIIATNQAGDSPPTVIQVPAQPAADLTICDNSLLDNKLKKKTCLEWRQLQDGDSRTGSVITVTTKKERKQITKQLKDYVRYLYTEHRCDDGTPRTVNMCLFYKKEGVPLREPQELNVFNQTHTSANFSWKAIPSEDQQGFITHYSLCSVKMSSQDGTKVCHNVSASLLKYRVENLTPGTKYNISLAGVTRAGVGPEATITINTPRETSMNVWWSLGLLFLFFFLTTMCTCTLKRIQTKLLPPVPTPVIPDSIYLPESQQEYLERKEELHELTLSHQPEIKSVPEDVEETTVLTGEWDEGTDEDEDDGGDSRVSGGPGDECPPGSTDQALRSSKEEMTDLDLDNEIAMLIYRNGLVLDVKMD